MSQGGVNKNTITSPKNNSPQNSQTSNKGSSMGKTPFNQKTPVSSLPAIPFQGTIKNNSPMEGTQEKPRGSQINALAITFAEIVSSKTSYTISEPKDKDFLEIFGQYPLVHTFIDPDVLSPANIIFKKQYLRARRSQKLQARFIKQGPFHNKYEYRELQSNTAFLVQQMKDTKEKEMQEKILKLQEDHKSTLKANELQKHVPVQEVKQQVPAQVDKNNVLPQVQKKEMSAQEEKKQVPAEEEKKTVPAQVPKQVPTQVDKKQVSVPVQVVNKVEPSQVEKKSVPSPSVSHQDSKEQMGLTRLKTPIFKNKPINQNEHQHIRQEQFSEFLDLSPSRDTIEKSFDHDNRAPGMVDLGSRVPSIINISPIRDTSPTKVFQAPIEPSKIDIKNTTGGLRKFRTQNEVNDDQQPTPVKKKQVNQVPPKKEESVKSKLILMNNLSEEDSFAASNIEDDDIALEESIVNHAAKQKPKKKEQSQPPKVVESKTKSPKQEKKEEKPQKVNKLRLDKSPPKFVKEPSPKKGTETKTNSTTSTQQDRQIKIADIKQKLRNVAATATQSPRGFNDNAIDKNLNSNSTLGKVRNLNHSTVEHSSKPFSILPNIKNGVQKIIYNNTGGRSSLQDTHGEYQSINEVDSGLEPESIYQKSSDEYSFKPNIAQHQINTQRIYMGKRGHGAQGHFSPNHQNQYTPGAQSQLLTVTHGSNKNQYYRMMYEINHHQRHQSLNSVASIDKLPNYGQNNQQPFSINIKLLLKDPALMAGLASGDIGIEITQNNNNSNVEGSRLNLPQINNLQVNNASYLETLSSTGFKLGTPSININDQNTAQVFSPDQGSKQQDGPVLPNQNLRVLYPTSNNSMINTKAQKDINMSSLKSTNSKQTHVSSINDYNPQQLEVGVMSPHGSIFQSLSNNSSQGLPTGVANVARNAKALPMLANIDFESKKRYNSVRPRVGVQDNAILKNGIGLKRLNMLNAISRIDEVSQAQNDVTFLDTERSSVQQQQFRSNQLFTGANSNANIRPNKWAIQRDTKAAAKLLFNIKEPNRLEKLLNGTNSHNYRSSPRINNNEANTNEHHVALAT